MADITNLFDEGKDFIALAVEKLDLKQKHIRATGTATPSIPMLRMLCAVSSSRM